MMLSMKTLKLKDEACELLREFERSDNGVGEVSLSVDASGDCKEFSVTMTEDFAMMVLRIDRNRGGRGV